MTPEFWIDMPGRPFEVVRVLAALPPQRAQREAARASAPHPLPSGIQGRHGPQTGLPGGKGAASPLGSGGSTACPPSDAAAVGPAPQPDAGGGAAREGAGRGPDSLIHVHKSGKPHKQGLSGPREQQKGGADETTG